MPFNIYIFLMFLTWRLAESSVKITAVPEKIHVGLTNTFHLSCSLPKSNYGTVISIHILHSTGQNFTDLASIDASKSIKDKHPNITNISGYINASETSYLNLSWAYPRSSQAGNYLCKVIALNEYYYPINEEVNYTVSTDKPDFELVIQELGHARTEVEEHYKSYSEQWRTYMENFTKFYFTELPVSMSGSTKYLLSKQENVTAMKADIMCNLLGGFLAEMNPSEQSQIVAALNNTIFNPATAASVSSTNTTPNSASAHTTPNSNTTIFPLANLILIGGSDADGTGDWVYMRNKQSVQFNVTLTHNPGKDCLAFGVNENFDVVAVPCSEPNINGTATFLCQLPS